MKRCISMISLMCIFFLNINGQNEVFLGMQAEGIVTPPGRMMKNEYLGSRLALGFQYGFCTGYNVQDRYRITFSWDIEGYTYNRFNDKEIRFSSSENLDLYYQFRLEYLRVGETKKGKMILPFIGLSYRSSYLGSQGESNITLHTADGIVRLETTVFTRDKLRPYFGIEWKIFDSKEFYLGWRSLVYLDWKSVSEGQLMIPGMESLEYRMNGSQLNFGVIFFRKF